VTAGSVEESRPLPELLESARSARTRSLVLVSDGTMNDAASDCRRALSLRI
jgi:hypothetical protein